MDIESVREYCLSRRGAEECLPFDDTTLVYKVMGKMFAVLSLDRTDWLVLKCDPEYAIELRDRYIGAIEPAWHFNKKYWNQHAISKLSDSLIKELIDHSITEVIKKLPKIRQQEYWG